MLDVAHPNDYFRAIEAQVIEDEVDNILLGLRIYSKKEAPARISGQLRRGQLSRSLQV